MQHPFIIDAFTAFGVGAGGTDPDFSSVVQLAHFDGTAGSTTFTNHAAPRGNTLTAQGTAALSTTQSKWGGASLFVNSSGSARNAAGAGTVSDYQFGTGAFTWEFWVRLSDITNVQVLYAWSDSGSTYLLIGTTGSGSLRLTVDSTARITTSTGVMATNTWKYVSYSRGGGNGYLHVDGVNVGSWADSTFNYSGQGLVVGNYAGADAPLISAYVDDVRVTKGVARYTSANYTPPTAAHPNS